MIWLTWRQSRAQVAAAAAVLLTLLVAVAVTWPGVAGLARSSGLTGCGSGCAEAAGTFLRLFGTHAASPVYYAGIIVVHLLPALAGVFWGAPLIARELESGTYRMVWSQSVSRERWLLVKLAGGVLVVALAAGAAGLAVTAWSAPIDAAYGNRITPVVFAARGVVPIGYAVFAFVAGAAAGLLARRTLPAMAVTLVLLVAVQAAFPLAVRQLLAEPVTTVTAIDPAGQHLSISVDDADRSVRAQVDAEVTGAWLIGNRVVTTTGAEFAGPVDPQRCGPEATAGPGACLEWMTSQRLRQELTQVPGSRFWTVQWREFGVLMALAAVMAAFCLWWVRRRTV